MKTKRASRRGRQGRGHNGSMQRGRDIGHFFHPGALRPVPLEWPASPRAVSRARSSLMPNKLVHQHRQQESDKHLDVHPPACVNPINLAPPEAHSHPRPYHSLPIKPSRLRTCNVSHTRHGRLPHAPIPAAPRTPCTTEQRH